MKRFAHVEARIEHIAGLMRRLKFKRGVTIKRLAKDWGLSLDRVKEISALASKRVLLEVTDPEAVTLKVCTAIERVIDDALRDMRRGAQVNGTDMLGEPCTYTLDPNKARRIVVDAGKQWATITGAVAPTRVTLREEPVEKLSDEELEGAIREFLRGKKKKKGGDT